MTDKLATLSKLKENLEILNTLAGEYGGDVPQKLTNQIDNHVKAISLTRQVITGEIAEADWQAAIRPLGVTIDSGQVVNLDTGGGTFIQEGVKVEQGDFVGRDKIEHHYHIEQYGGPTAMRLDYEAEIRGLLDYYNNRFVAREPEIKKVFSFTNPDEGNKTKPYLLLKAQGGFGKSTLMAHLVHLAKRDQWQGCKPHIIFFFIRQRAGRHSPTSFLQALNSQLLDLLEVSGGIPGTFDELRVQFSQLWGAAQTIPSPEKPLLLLIDALDEMALPSETQPVTIADLLPIPSSRHVRVIVSSRPNPPPKERVGREHPLRTAPEIELTTFDMGGVLRVVKRTLTEKQRQLHADFKMEPETAVQNIAQAVLDLTGGEPLFTRFMAEEILTGGLSAIENLKKNPPEDVGDYFRVQFEALDDLADSNTTWEILKFLVIARSGLTLDELAGLLEKPKRKVRVALENLGRFLLGEERVELMHARLHERVREEFTFHELETGQQRLLAWCRGYQERGWPANTPDYILDEYGGHLADTGDTQALYKLIGPEYMKRQFEASRSYTGFVRDAELALALASAGKDPDWVPLCRASLAIATLGSAATNAPPTAIGVLAQFGYMEEAIGYTELIQNPLNRAEAYGRIALACLKRNEREEAAEWVGAAVESLEDKELLGELEGAILPMAAVFEALDDIEGVVFLIDTAQRIGFSNWTARSMAEVVLALCRMDELGKIEDVLKENAPDADFLRKLLEQAADSNHDLEALYKIIIEVIQGKLASEAEDESLHGILSVVYSRLGKTAEAELSADQALALLTAEDKKINVRTAVWLATLFQANQLINQADQSYKLFDEIFDNFAPGGNRFSNDAFNISYALEEYANGLSHTEDEAGLIQLLEKANEAEFYALDFEGLYIALASALARMGRTDLAIDTAARIEREDSDGSFEESAWLGVIDGLARIGLLQEAEKALERNHYPTRVASMGIIASAWAKFASTEPDNVEAEQKAVNWAYAAIAEASSLAGEHFQAAAYGSCAVALAEIGETEKARAAANRALAETKELRSGGQTLQVVRPIIAAYLAVGDIPAARSYAASVSWSADNTLGPIVRAFHAAGDTNQAWELWRTIIQAVQEEEFQYDIILKLSLIADLAFLLGEAPYGRELLQEAIARLRSVDQQWREGKHWRGVGINEIAGYIKVCVDYGLPDYLEPALDLLHQQPVWEVLESEWIPGTAAPPKFLKKELEPLERELFELSETLAILPDTADQPLKAVVLAIKHAIAAAESSLYFLPNSSSLKEAVARLLQAGKQEFLREVLPLTVGSDLHGWQIAEYNGSIAAGAAQAGNKAMAVEYFVKAIVQSRLNGRLAFFSALGTGAAVLTSLDQPDLLWQVYQTCEEVDSWWEGRR